MRNEQALMAVTAASLVVQVSGSRDWADRRAVRAFLDDLHGSGLGPVDVVVSGMARGVDAMAATWARDREVHLVAFPAEWDRLGNSAGVVRNREMAMWSMAARRRGADVQVVAWMNVGSRGTANMVRSCRAVGLPVTVFGPGSEEVSDG